MSGRASWFSKSWILMPLEPADSVLVWFDGSPWEVGMDLRTAMLDRWGDVEGAKVAAFVESVAERYEEKHREEVAKAREENIARRRELYDAARDD